MISYPSPLKKKEREKIRYLKKKKKKKRKRKNLPIKMISTQLIHVHEAKNRKLIFVIIHICECEVCEERGIVRTGRNLSSRNTRSTIRHSSPTGKHEKRTKWGRKRERQRERERERKTGKKRKKERKKRKGTKLRSGGRKQRGRNLIHPARPGRTKGQTHTDINNLEPAEQTTVIVVNTCN